MTARSIASTALAVACVAAPTAALVAPATADAHNADPAHKHNAFSKYVMLEQFGVTATEIFLGWEFVQSSSLIGVPAVHGDSYCNHSLFPGWNTTLCEQQAYKNTASYGQEVKADAWGDFYSNFGPAYGMHTYGWVSNYGNSYKHACDLYWGSRPVAWDDNHCYGAW